MTFCRCCSAAVRCCHYVGFRCKPAVGLHSTWTRAPTFGSAVAAAIPLLPLRCSTTCCTFILPAFAYLFFWFRSVTGFHFTIAFTHLVRCSFLRLVLLRLPRALSFHFYHAMPLPFCCRCYTSGWVGFLFFSFAAAIFLFYPATCWKYFLFSTLCFCYWRCWLDVLPPLPIDYVVLLCRWLRCRCARAPMVLRHLCRFFFFL